LGEISNKTKPKTKKGQAKKGKREAWMSYDDNAYSVFFPLSEVMIPLPSPLFAREGIIWPAETKRSTMFNSTKTARKMFQCSMEVGCSLEF
jgi:hypothetical protein